MSLADILARLFGPKGVTPARILKAQAAAQRSGIAWSAVLAAMTTKQRARVEGQ
jgi:hypothetical protein